MNLRLTPHKLRGSVPAIASKSMAHRFLICAALTDSPTELLCSGSSQDIQATVHCLTALGADIQHQNGGFLVYPRTGRISSDLYCGESGSTLRFLLPVVAALGESCLFHMAGRLHQRPLSPLEEELCAHGLEISRPDERRLWTRGELRAGSYTLPGNVSSQFISGLLLALPLLKGVSCLTVTGPMESASYVHLTLQALKTFGIPLCWRGNQFLLSPAPYRSPGRVQVEGDWSSAAFWFGANALGSAVTVTGLDGSSLQGDRAIDSLLSRLGQGRSIDIAQTPDLFPILAVASTCADGATHFIGGARLRLKESNRLESVARMMASLGGKIQEKPEGMTVYPAALTGGTVEACGDHRIAMAAAIAATCCASPVTILGTEAVNKSYPGFWRDYTALGGQLEEV